MTEFVDQQIRADLLGHSLALAQKHGVHPVYFTRENRLDPDPCYAKLIDLSRYFWTCFGYTGLMQPWHEEADCIRTLRKQRDYIRKWLWICEDMDVDWRSYCVLSFAMTDYQMYERPTLLVGQRPHWGWMRRFRKHAGSRELVDETAFFLLEFMRLQIGHKGRAYIHRMSFLEIDEDRARKSKKKKPLKLGLYFKIADRIRMFKHQGIDYLDWLGAKYLNCRRIDPESTVAIKTIVNFNTLDPSLEGLKAAASDEWRSIREFLGLSTECEFPDGCIPKGWQPASDDIEDRKKIRKITADGYYYLEDGTQRRGKRHYATNKYLTIKIGPANFAEFRESWNDPRYLSGRPTWEEYERYALYPGLWNEEGENVSSYPAIKDVRWRKR